MEYQIKDSPTIEVYKEYVENGENIEDCDLSAIEASMNILSITKRVMTMIVKHFQKHNLSPGKYSILINLYRNIKNTNQGMKPSELKSLTGLTKATITNLLRNLEHEGLIISKKSNNRDKRSKNVYVLSNLGEKFITNFFPIHFQKLTKIASHLSDSQKIFIKDLNNLTFN